MLRILHENVGFDRPERWVDYGIQHSFKRVEATTIAGCPDCGSPPRGRIGQYIYYSTLVGLQECSGCGLIWADAKLDPVVIGSHFEVVYKDDTYFAEARRLTFWHMARMVDRLAPRAARILDIGGAKGHLMHRVQMRRPDLRIVVNDISKEATRQAAEMFGFDTVQGDAHALAHHREKYDVVILSDVLYYITDIAALWNVLASLLAPGGALLVRIPNKLVPIRVCQAFKRVRRRVFGDDGLDDRVPCFNPEHIYVFSTSYLRRRLASVGFDTVRVVPSPPICVESRVVTAVLAGTFGILTGISRLSGDRVTLSPSMLVVARRSTGVGRRETGESLDG
jgi:SAM-dependent methyltransferase